MISDTPIEFRALRIGQRNGRTICCDAIPDLLHQIQPILNREAVDAE